MNLTILASGSKGNALHLEAGGTAFLVDAGLSCKQLEMRLAHCGLDPAHLSGILVTHEHSDHIRGISVLSRRYGLTVHVAGRLWARLRHDDLNWHDVRPFDPSDSFTLGPVRVQPFRTRHDATDPVGFTFQHEGVKFGVLTDCGAPTAEIGAALAGCDGLLLESNHDEGLLQRGPYPPHLKARIASDWGHLSNRQSARLLKELVSPRLRYVALGHLSEENNSPEFAYNACAHSLRNVGHAVSLVIAPQHSPCRTLSLVPR